MPITTIEKAPSKTGPITIKPFFDPAVPNMGLEKYGLSLWDGTYHEEQLVLIDDGINRRYVNGLNESAPEIKNLPKELRDAKVLEIRKTIAKLEKEVAHNKIPDEAIHDIDDKLPKTFMEYVTKFHPDNDSIWGKVSLRCGNQPVFLDPEDPDDLIKYYAIEAGGFPLVARSYEDAKSRATPPKFYLDRYEETASTVTEIKKIKNRALTALQEMFDGQQVKLMYVAKVTDYNSAQYKKSTPIDIIYDNMDKYISGDGAEKSKKRAAQTFLDNSRQDLETLKLRAVIKDATFYKFIGLKSDGFIYHMKSSTNIGRNPSDVLEYLKNPLNDQILGAVLKEVERLWI